MTHDLRSWPVNFQRLLSGCECEVRRNDRNFRPDDLAHISEFLPTANRFTDRTQDFRIKWVMTADETEGLKLGFVVLVYARIQAAGQLPPSEPPPARVERPLKDLGAWIADANPVMMIAEDVTGERHQLVGDGYNQAAGIGAVGRLKIYRTGRREFVLEGCDHDFSNGVKCPHCGIPRSMAVL